MRSLRPLFVPAGIRVPQPDQWFHGAYDPSDVNKLDGRDRDRIVCESWPE